MNIKNWMRTFKMKVIPKYRGAKKRILKVGNIITTKNRDEYKALNESGLKAKLNKWKSNPKVLYPTFIVSASLICILAIQILPESKFRNWYYDMTHKPVVSKAIEYNKAAEDVRSSGQFMTYYRFHSFGSSNPSAIDENAPMIALTFDDGPNPTYTTRILDTLKANYSHATFFVVGDNSEKYQDTLKEIALAGCEIGNHTYSHANLTSISDAKVEEELDKVDRAVKKATGENTTVIRPPYGAYDDDLLELLDKPVILWDLDTEDWDSRNAQKIVDNIMDTVKDGDIILMHDIYDSTAEAVEILVPKLKEQGYQIVTVSELAKYKGRPLELNKAYGGFERTPQ